MGSLAKRGYFGKHAKSSAALVSLAIHVVIILVAVSFVTVRIIVKDDQAFEPKQISRPRMRLKKLTVPVNIKQNKTQMPKLRKNIVAKPKKTFVDIKMPEITGVKGGTGYLSEGGLSGIGFELEITLFGGDKGSGNELEGTFFDLKMKPDGSPAKMDENYYKDALRDFCNSWNITRLESKYFKAPKSKFATTFMLPKMKAEEAPKAYGVEDVVQPKQWAAYYKGKIAAPETGRYRFWGIADDTMLVRIKKKLVIDASLHNMHVTDWSGTDKQDNKYRIHNRGIRVGDWFHLTKGRPTDMEVLVGERPGGVFYCMLLIEQDGVEYPEGADGRPILPIFKTQEIPEKLIPEMAIEPGTASTDGPSFGVLQ